MAPPSGPTRHYESQAVTTGSKQLHATRMPEKVHLNLTELLSGGLQEILRIEEHIKGHHWKKPDMSECSVLWCV